VLAEPAADRLLTLMPAAGHLVHMPSHIYQRIGRYADAVRSNELAVLADEDYITQCRAQGLYPMAYYPHNIHFLWFGATMEGRSELAIAMARKTAAQVSDSALAALPLLAGFRVVPWYALTRFGHWDEMLAERRPASGDRFLLGIWTYARGLALTAKGKRDEAGRLLDSLRTIVKGEGLDYTLFSPNTARRILNIAPEVLAGELASQRATTMPPCAISRPPVRLEDGLTYTEPEEWHYPRVMRWARCCWRRGARARPRRSTGKISNAIPRTAGRCAALPKRSRHRDVSRRPPTREHGPSEPGRART
jgi:hypothetical protein